MVLSAELFERQSVPRVIRPRVTAAQAGPKPNNGHSRCSVFQCGCIYLRTFIWSAITHTHTHTHTHTELNSGITSRKVVSL